MKEKVIRPKSPLLFCFIILILIMLSVCIAGNIVGFLEYGLNWLPFILLLTTLFLMTYLCCLLISFISKKIIINDKFISVKKDRFSKILMAIQQEVEIDFHYLSNVYLTISSNDSHNRSRFGLFTPMLYIALESVDGRTDAINVFYYTKKQIIEVLNDIIQRAKSQANLIECESGEKIYNEFKVKNNKH